MPKSVVSVTIIQEGEKLYSVQSNITGKQLFSKVINDLELREVWYFGLKYKDSKQDETWLKLNNTKVFSHDLLKENPHKMRFGVKFYPEDVEELIQYTTVSLFYKEVKEAILKEEVYCPPEKAVLLAAFSLQVENEKLDTENPPKMELDELICKRVFEPYNLTDEQVMEKIHTFWRLHAEKDKEEAMLEYLKIAQDLEMYGVSYFDIKNKKGSELLLGVDSLGVNIYEKSDMLTPKIGFPWSEISNISFNDKKFIIKPVEKKSPEFVFYTSRLKINKRILSLCMGNHEMYRRRRNVQSSAEVEQMKAKKQEETALKEAKKGAEYARRNAEKEEKRKIEEERERLAMENERLAAWAKEMEEINFQSKEELEKVARENEEIKTKYEMEKESYETQLKETVMLTEKEKQEKIERVEKLEAELQEVQHRKEMLEIQEAERQAKEKEMRQSTVIKHYTTPPTAILSQGGVRQPVRQTHHEHFHGGFTTTSSENVHVNSSIPKQQPQQQVSFATERQNSQEHDQLYQAKEKEMRQSSMIKHYTTPPTAILSQGGARQPVRQTHHEHFHGGFTHNSASVSHVQHNGSTSSENVHVDSSITQQQGSFATERQNSQEHDQNGSTSGHYKGVKVLGVEETEHELSLNRIFSRKRLDERSDKAQEQEKNLKELTKSLESSVIPNRKTHVDILHNQNQQAGRDKYRTLKKIQQGNTKQRKDIFEGM